MKIEHVAFNVTDPPAMAAWYCEHLGFTVKLETGTAQAHFLADSTGAVMIEIYANPPGEAPDYAAMNPLQLHLAFVCDTPQEDCDRLVAAGATEVEDIQPGDGSHIKMMRDPWGFPIQLCKRAVPMV